MTITSRGFDQAIVSLNKMRRIALVLWCMDRAFKILDGVQLLEDQPSVRPIRDAATALWKGPGDAWSSGALKQLREQCEAYDSEAVHISSIDTQMLSPLFTGIPFIKQDHIVNAITDTVSIVWFLTKVISTAEATDVIGALEAYYDIFYQPTWDLLTGDKKSVRPDELGKVRQNEENTEPLKSALDLVDKHIQFLQDAAESSVVDKRLRGC